MKDDKAKVLSMRTRSPRHQPRQAVFFQAGRTSISISALLSFGRGGRARWYPRSSAGSQALRRWCRRASVLSERAPAKRPSWLRTATLSFPSGRKAEEVVVDDAAGLAWIVNLGCIELHPHPVRAGDLEHPDELRVDLDPGPGVAWDDVRRVALEVKAFLEEMGLRGWPKTSGSRGMHVNARIEPRWTFVQVRRAALALSRAVERRAPALASSKWWKEERHGVFLDYNQNAKDRTTCSAYSVRPLADARVSTPLHWHEVADCDPADFTVLTVPKRFAELGDPHADIDATPGSLEKLLELAAEDEAAGLGDAPWPPHFRKMEDEPPRVQPSRARGAEKKPPRRSRGPGRRLWWSPTLRTEKPPSPVLKDGRVDIHKRPAFSPWTTC